MVSETNSFYNQRSIKKDHIEVAEDIFQDFWFKTISTLKRKLHKQSLAQEDLFQDFWLLVQKESEKEMRSKLSEEVLELRKKELWRKHISLVSLAPFAALMAVELITLCGNVVLLTLVSSALRHTVMPFEALSFICVLYLIYNNRRIRKKEQELSDLEEKEYVDEKADKNEDNIYDYLNYIEAITTAIVIISDIANMILTQEHWITKQQGIEVDEVAFLLSNLVSVSISCASFYIEKKKTDCNKGINQDKVAAGLMLTSSCTLLMRRIILMALALSLNAHNATTIGTVIGPVIGLVGIGCSIVGHILIISSCRSQLQDLNVSGRGIERGTTSNTISTSSPSSGAAELAASI